MASRAASASYTREIQTLNEQIRALGNDNDSLRTTLKPIMNMAITTGVSIQQAIASLYAEKTVDMEQSQLRLAKVGVSDFHRMIKTYDDHFRDKSFDSAVDDYTDRGLFESGMYIKGMIDFAKDYRRKRDNSIDSALVRLEQLGVNTDTLRFPRRLPIRIGQSLKHRATVLGLYGGDLNSVLMCDTL
jgi:hypothetical protein